MQPRAASAGLTERLSSGVKTTRQTMCLCSSPRIPGTHRRRLKSPVSGTTSVTGISPMRSFYHPTTPPKTKTTFMSILPMHRFRTWIWRIRVLFMWQKRWGIPMRMKPGRRSRFVCRLSRIPETTRRAVIMWQSRCAHRIRVRVSLAMSQAEPSMTTARWCLPHQTGVRSARWRWPGLQITTVMEIKTTRSS